ncbi:glycosyltransferase [Saccharopolyspora mangrovi]|uniref:Glycosyltransferase n=1 Tax=Saccharopolyspora mangrovi TaxID=3082379 RepID=A0ABU6AK04_9PSEU|nr:glycosyltransferase [Saccharopolyspora sp. S2-29]MEB3371640.1 glycosyltransferase [Saccharopolyspora sp. S2-29]
MTLVGGFREVGENEVRPADRQAAPRPGELGAAVAMRTFFTPPFAGLPVDLYTKIEDGAATRHRTAVTVHPHSTVSTSTYFGRFPASYWQRWTAVGEVTVRANVSGAGIVRVMASDSKGGTRTLHTERVAGTTETAALWTVSTGKFADGGAIWVELVTEADPLQVADVEWLVPHPHRGRPTTAVLCTHNRPEDCLNTLRALAADPAAMSALSAVYVVDQGDDTLESRESFESVREMFSDRLHYLRQRNLGGAGGFTRGLHEVLADEDVVANALFMDDDILLEPDTVVRMTTFANSAVEPVVVGSQMLQLLHPYQIHVSAEHARFTTIEPGLAVEGGLDRADLTEELQDRRVDADYNAWWCCLLPSEIVRDAGYPIPMFFQWDDVEFGYRIRGRGHATVTLPGAAVWHADFDWKDEESWVRYFTLRNALIIDALHGDFNGTASAKVFLRWAAECLVSMRYAQAEVLIAAVEDFLTGPAVLHDGDASTVGRIAELRSRHPETARHKPSQVPGLTGSSRPIRKAGPAPAHRRLVLAKRLVWHLLGKVGGSASISSGDAHWWHVGLFETAVVTDASQESVSVRRVDRDELRRIGRKALRTALRLRREGDRARAAWRDGHSSLTDRKNWTRLFQLDENTSKE